MSLSDIQADFPNLKPGEWKQSSPRDDGYNCIAFAVHDARQFWDPDSIGVKGYYWPPGIPKDFRVSTLIKLYEIHGFTVCASADLEETYERIAIYGIDDEGTHAARQLQKGVWTSKLGPEEDIEHQTPEGLESDLYGHVLVIMKRKRQ
jgi:hypothetical protein